MKIQVLAKYFFVNSRKASERGKSIYKYVIDERAQLDKEERKKTKQEKVFLKRRKSVNTVISPKAKENRQKPFKASESKQRITSFRK